MVQLGAVVAFALLGVAAGALTGIIPGLHVNNLALLVLAAGGALTALVLSIFPAASLFDIALLTASLITSVAVTHTFVNCIPSTFLGAPDESTSLSVLPAHRMTLEGRGYEAVELSAMGSLGGLLVSFSLLVPVFIVIGPPMGGYEKVINTSVVLILIVVVAILVLDEGSRPAKTGVALNGIVVKGGDEPSEDVSSLSLGNRARVEGLVTRACGGSDFWLRDATGEVHIKLKFGNAPEPGRRVSVAGKAVRGSERNGGAKRMALALAVFGMAGALGSILLIPEGVAGILPTPVKADDGAVLLLPLFSGLFGLPLLISSMKGRDRVPPQGTRARPKLPGWRRARGALSGTVGGCVTGWLPGASSAVAAAISAQLSGCKGSGDDESDEFIVSVSAVSTANAIFNLLALFVLMRARSGAMKAVQGIMGDNVELWTSLGSVPWALMCLLAVVLVSGAMAFLITLWVGKRAAKLLPRLSYRPLAVGVCCFMVAISLVFGGLLGSGILACAYFIGKLPEKLGVRRVHLMGCIIVPTLWFLMFA
ncbi:MAG: tripartite tricarboxylate transporter permease [Methanobacteriota archaeon]